MNSFQKQLDAWGFKRIDSDGRAIPDKQPPEKQNENDTQDPQNIAKQLLDLPDLQI